MPYPAKLSPQTILDSALALLEREGPDGLSMRLLADALQVRPSSLYRHYADRAALLVALEETAIRSLLADLQGATVDPTPAERLHQAGQAYLAYARAHPHLYSLLLAPRAPYVAGPGPGKDLWNLVLELVGAATGLPDDTSATVAFWAFLHGYVVMERSGLFGISGPGQAFERGLRAFSSGLSLQGAASPA